MHLGHQRRSFTLSNEVTLSISPVQSQQYHVHVHTPESKVQPRRINSSGQAGLRLKVVLDSGAITQRWSLKPGADAVSDRRSARRDALLVYESGSCVRQRCVREKGQFSLSLSLWEPFAGNLPWKMSWEAEPLGHRRCNRQVRNREKTVDPPLERRRSNMHQDTEE